MHLYDWKIFTQEESLNIPTALAIECPHCGTVIKISKETVQDYLNEGARLFQVRCIEPDCDSNSKYADELDIPLLDLRNTENVAWAEDGSTLTPTPFLEVIHTDATT
jgi:hypothetical protein